MAFITSPIRAFPSTACTRPSINVVHRPRIAIVPNRRTSLPRMQLTVGSPAIDFTLPITGGSTISLSDLFAKAGTVVLYFYPKDATSGCTVEAQDFRDMKAELDAMDVAVVGVSRDSVESHNAFSEDLNLNFPLISDDGTLSEGYGVWKLKKLGDKELMAIERSTFILRDGKVVKEWRGVKSGGHAADVLAALKEM